MDLGCSRSWLAAARMLVVDRLVEALRPCRWARSLRPFVHASPHLGWSSRDEALGPGWAASEAFRLAHERKMVGRQALEVASECPSLSLLAE